MEGSKLSTATGAEVVLDLHGKNKYQARVAIEAALRRSKGLYRIRAIHGFHNGTALKDMVWSEYGKDPRVKRLAAASESATDLILRELY
ncbi:MAG TPA: Smr/MutS family protein [Candidatus Cryosericum sp.]|nr:Smr/MutS family protein [Candidatus Cryosericum sp.]